MRSACIYSSSVSSTVAQSNQAMCPVRRLKEVHIGCQFPAVHGVAGFQPALDFSAYSSLMTVTNCSMNVTSYVLTYIGDCNISLAVWRIDGARRLLVARSPSYVESLHSALRKREIPLSPPLLLQQKGRLHFGLIVSSTSHSNPCNLHFTTGPGDLQRTCGAFGKLAEVWHADKQSAPSKWKVRNHALLDFGIWAHGKLYSALNV